MKSAEAVQAPQSISLTTVPAKGASIGLNWKRFTFGASVYATLNWLYDYPLYSVVIFHWGILTGGLMMAALSIPVDLVTFRFYDWSKKDWFGIEYIKSTKLYSGSNPLKRFSKFILTKTPLPVQIALLSTKFNSFMVTALLRDGVETYDGLSKRDWAIFWSSYLIAQTYWIGVIGSGVFAITKVGEFVLQ